MTVWLSRENIRAGLHTSSAACLKSWRDVLVKREAEFRHFVPEWPAVADSFAEDIRAIDARLAELSASDTNKERAGATT